MSASFDKYRFQDGRTPLGAGTFNPIFRDIDARIAHLESLGVDWRTAVRQVSDYGLVRVNELLAPALESINTSQQQAEAVAADIAALVSDLSVLITAHEAENNPHGQYLSAVAGTALVAAHEAAADPHSQYLTRDEGDGRYVQPDQLEPGVPTGVIVSWPGEAPPSGWLECDGSLLLRADYTALWQMVEGSNNSASEAEWASSRWGGFSNGNGSTTFRLPDLRGEFIRGWDHGRGVDSGRGLGAQQDSLFQEHSHNLTVGSSINIGSQTVVHLYEDRFNAKATTLLSSGSTGGTETRPRNTAAMRIIKY